MKTFSQCTIVCSVVVYRYPSIYLRTSSTQTKISERLHRRVIDSVGCPVLIVLCPITRYVQ